MAATDLPSLLRMGKGMVKKISFEFHEAGVEVTIVVPSGKTSTHVYGDPSKISEEIVKQIAALLF